ncbi:MAG: M14 family metallopeptidase [Gemmatimonadaceae bacterium]
MQIRPLTAALAALSLVIASPAAAQKRVPSPQQQFGHNFGEDYWLPNYTQLLGYWNKLAAQSDRMKLVRIGTTNEKRPMVMAIISSPENLKHLDRFQAISAKLAHAEGLTDDQARRLAGEGRAVVWIDGGLHSNESLGVTQLGQIVYDLLSQTDPETQRILKECIILAVPANPDGIELVGNWYMRRAEPTTRTLDWLPRLYNKYVGHDDNRDSYMASQPETQAMDSIMFRAWYPQIIYNHHQAGPAGTVMAAPPYRDPFNYNYDPLIPVELDWVGGAMNTRFIQEGKPGVTFRQGSTFSTWWNGGLRTTVYFHNMVGILTETIGNPTPMTIPVVPDRMLPSGSLPDPVMPGVWHFSQSLAYSISANRAVLDLATRQREQFLFNIYRMGKNSIERGDRDNWTITPTRVNVVRAAADSARARKTELTAEAAVAALHDPAARDARSYIIPANQPDFATAAKFVNALVKTGIGIQRATQQFTVARKTYPAGSYVVRSAQAFRPHILDMFEPQDHPNDFAYPGGPPIPPYDNAGWTLAYQMGINFDRILQPFDAPLQPLAGFARPVGSIAAQPAAGGMYTWSGAQNDAFVAANRLLKAGQEVDRGNDGDFFAPANERSRGILAAFATEKGVNVLAAAGLPTRAVKLHPLRIALWDVYGGSMESGWTRFLFDQFEFPYEVVYAPQLDAPDLRSRYDVIVLPDGATIGGTQERRRGSVTPPDDIPAEWKSHLGSMTPARTLPAIRSFLERGGVLLASGTATHIAEQLNVPVIEAPVDSAGRKLERSVYYIPGSVLSVRVDTSAVIARGMPARADVLFDNSPVFRLTPAARAAGVVRVAWFDSPAPLRSGWAWGQRYLDGTAAIVSAPVGAGMLYLYGPEMNFRSQSHGTFRFLFNALYPPVTSTSTHASTTASTNTANR